jgi:hypothetical protein
MLRSRTLAVFITIALAACSETQTPTSVIPPQINPPYIPPAQPAAVSLTGIVSSQAPLDNAVVLELDDQSKIIVVGSQAIGLASVTGALVLVEGIWSDGYDGDSYVLDAQRFEVLSVGGHAAVDGLLEATDNGFALRLYGGDLYELIDPPAALLEHMGARVWITMAEDGSFAAFGVISR